MDARVEQQLRHFIDAAREIALHRTACRAGGARIGCVNQIGNGFGLQQVHAAFEKGALGELTCPRPTCTQSHTQRDQFLQYRRSPVRLQFGHVFAGETVRPRKIQTQAIIQDGALLITKGAVRCNAWLECDNAAHTCGDVVSQRAGESDDANPCRHRTGGDGNDGIAVS